MPILSPARAATPIPGASHSSPWRSTALAALLASVVLLPLLGHRVLTAWDEGIYAEIAREMLAAHRWQAWVVPHFNGALWFEKPPLTLWLMAASMRLFGLNAFAARLPSALAGIAAVTTLHLWLRRRFSLQTAWLGTALLLGSFGFQHAARAGETDTLLSLCCLFGLIGLTNVLDAQPNGWLLFWAALSGALLTKGAAALPLLLTPLLLLPLAPALASGAPCMRRRLLLGATLCLLLAGAWPLALGWHFGHPFWAEFLGLHTLARATSTLEGHQTTPLFYLRVLLVSAPPFALLYPFATASAWRHRATTAKPLLPLLLFALLELLLFSVARTRLPHYIAPVYPCFSALTAVWLVRYLKPARTRSPLLLWASLALFFAAGTALTAHARKDLHINRLPNGITTPDNREAAALLQSALRQQPLPAGPLLVWHRDPATPFTTDAFYSRRLVEQLTPSPHVSGDTAGRYVVAPVFGTESLGAPQLLLLDQDLIARLPSPLRFTPLAAGPHQSVGILQLQPSVAHPH